MIDIFTKGGTLTYAMLIAGVLHRHGGKTTARITRFAFSGGTILALACNEIEMTRYGALGSVDPQAAWYGSLRNLREPLEKGEVQEGWVGTICGAVLNRHKQVETDFDARFEHLVPDATKRKFFCDTFSHETPITLDMIPNEFNVHEFKEPVKESVVVNMEARALAFQRFMTESPVDSYDSDSESCGQEPPKPPSQRKRKKKGKDKTPKKDLS